MRRRIGVRLAILAIGLGAGNTVGVAEEGGKDLTGNWTYFIGPRPIDGRLGTLQLKQEVDKLTGKAILPGGMSHEIQEGKVTKDKVFFFVQARPNGPKIHFAGDVLGNTIKGMTELEPPGQPKRAHFAWEAQRIAD